MMDELNRPGGTREAGLPASRWDSMCTRIAVVVGLVFAVFAPAVVLGSMEQEFSLRGAFVCLGLWGTAVCVDILARGLRQRLAWAALRYLVIIFCGSGLFVIILASRTPGYIRQMERFQGQMRREADIARIRKWASAYCPCPESQPTSNEKWSYVPSEDWPGCVRNLHPEHVRYTCDDRTIHIMFGSGFAFYGLSVGPEGTSPYGDYALPLEDGAWVWHVLQ